jgi:hypothetical protein
VVAVMREKNTISQKTLWGGNDQNAIINDVQIKYEEMALKMKGKRMMVEDLLQNTNLSFTEWVMKFPFPETFKIPHVKMYDGTTDLGQDLETYQAHLVLNGTLNEISWRAFPFTLKGNARDCFENLPPNSVDNFENLGRMFITHFIAGWRHKRP